MIEPEQLAAKFGRPSLALQVVAVTDAEAAARPFVGDVRQRQRMSDRAIAANQRTAALIGIGLDTVRADCIDDTRT